MTAGLIPPHGGTLVTRTGERPEGVESLERITLSGRELADLDMLASGALSPLRGFMGRADYEGVVESMQLAASGHMDRIRSLAGVAAAGAES